MTLPIPKWFWGISVFFLVFAFPLLPGLSSAKLIILVAITVLYCRNNLKEFVYKLKYYTGNFFVLLSIIAILTLFQTILFLSFDFSLLSKIISSFFLYPVCFIIYYETQRYYNIPKLILSCFVLQSGFIVLAMCSQSFYDLTQIFRVVDENQELTYGRLRGNAICGYQFFGISAMYTFVYIYSLLHLFEVKNKIIVFALLLIAGICSGRFAICGLLIGGLCLIIKWIYNGKIVRVIQFVFVGTIVSFSGVWMIYEIGESINDPIMSKVYEYYILQPIDSAAQNGELQTSSTDRLGEMYQEQEVTKYFWLGIGKYTSEDGHYFGSVDIGYYRMLAYYGIIGFLVVAYSVYYLIFRTKANIDTITKWGFLFNFIILNIKGDVLIWNNNIIPILVGFLFFSKSNSFTINKNKL